MEIISPGWPRAYSDNVLCEWRIQANTPGYRVELVFTDFNIEYAFDYVDVSSKLYCELIHAYQPRALRLFIRTNAKHLFWVQLQTEFYTGRLVQAQTRPEPENKFEAQIVREKNESCVTREEFSNVAKLF